MNSRLARRAFVPHIGLENIGLGVMLSVAASQGSGPEACHERNGKLSRNERGGIVGNGGHNFPFRVGVATNTITGRGAVLQFRAPEGRAA